MKVRLPNGLTIEGYSRAESLALYDEIFKKRTYVRHGIELHEGDVVFDVGANIGLFALFLRQELREFTVHSFEPIPDVFAKLSENTRDFTDQAKLSNVGLSDKEGETVFAFYPHLPCYSTAFPEQLDERWSDLEELLLRGHIQGIGHPRVSNSSGPFKWIRSWIMKGIVASAALKKDRVCRLSTLSKVLRNDQVDHIGLLKIDVEGGEWNVLQGIAPDDWARFRQIAMEVHDLEGSADRIEQLLRDRSFEVVVEREHQNRRSPLCMIYARRVRD